MTSREHPLQQQDLNHTIDNETFNQDDVDRAMNDATTVASSSSSSSSSLFVSTPTTSRRMGSQPPPQAQSGLTERTAGSATITVTETPTMASVQDEILVLTLRGISRVTWDEATLDNEGLGRKSSKRCCIFHKQRAFDESSTDSSEYDSDNGSNSSSSSGGDDDDSNKGTGTSDGDRKMPAAKSKKGDGNKKIARRKKGTRKIPDSQRFHA